MKKPLFSKLEFLLSVCVYSIWFQYGNTAWQSFKKKKENYVRSNSWDGDEKKKIPSTFFFLHGTWRKNKSIQKKVKTAMDSKG